MKIIPAAIYRTQLKAVKKYSRSVLTGRKAQGVHDLRVAVLKTESALKTFSKFIPDNDGLGKRLKAVRDVMGKVRDIDILLSQRGLNIPQGLRKNIERQRQERLRQAVELLKSFFYANLLDDLTKLSIRRAPLKKSFIKKKLAAVRGDALRQKRKLHSPGSFHRLRRILKEWRYTCEFFNDKRPLEPITKLQNILGKRQDAAGGITSLSVLTPDRDSGQIKGFIRKEKSIIHKAEKKFEKIWKKKVE